MSVGRPDAASTNREPARSGPRIWGDATPRRLTTPILDYAHRGLELADRAAERRDAYDAAMRLADYEAADRCMRQAVDFDRRSFLELLDLAELVIERS